MRENRSTFLMCSCTALEHGLRGGRILDLQRRTGVCSDVGNKTGNIRDVRTPRVASYQYAARLAQSVFVLSLTGNGFSNHREVEALAAGAIPVVDDYLSGGKDLYDDASFPIVHVPTCGWEARKVAPVWCHPEKITRSWLESKYDEIEARRETLNLRKIYWPYWLYYVFEQVPPRKTSNASRAAPEVVQQVHEQRAPLLAPLLKTTW
jgi:hypothetical protein